jgi:hypothetical protein
MVDMWGFDDLVGNGGSYLLFTNGLNNVWSVASHLEDLSDTILALNFPNGTHHSDLGHDWPLNDTEDIEKGHDQSVEIFWEAGLTIFTATTMKIPRLLRKGPLRRSTTDDVYVERQRRRR